ncbi:hypothetical protein F5Y02DRAFT_143513 [Annulohypoxylon stygium]|nr:hypothetical protein F5Y02DRAFT_143513 [Annulohypoxylon stygium]
MSHHHRRRSNNEALLSQPKPEQGLVCLLCGHHRSSRRLNQGPNSILDRFICSRTSCRGLKELLTKSSHPHPVIQINYYECASYSQSKKRDGAQHTAARDRDATLPNVVAAGFPAFELSEQSSLAGRAELAGDYKYRSAARVAPRRSRVYTGDSEPPPVRYSTKPTWGR